MTAETASLSWAELPERGTPLMLRAIHWIAISAGRPLAKLLLYPVTLYFLLTAHRARRASREFLSRVHQRPARWRECFRHFYYFAVTVLDRVYLLRGDFDRFQVTLYQKELLHQQVESGRGCILLGSHLGSFEVLRTLGVTYAEFPLRVLMDTVHNKNITRYLDALNPEIARTVIAADRPDFLLQVRESLEGGYLIGTLGDRPTTDGKTASCFFLGAPASFPAGPTLLSAVMRCPIILFFGLYQGGNRYEIHFEKLADEVVLARERRLEDVRSWTQRYVDRLEHYTRLAPENWFNFYPFWGSPASDRGHTEAITTAGR